ncbi:protein CFAP276 isoform X2 [Cylas formicarius]|uniref:protein CFAP276 isoform X2 n=1 Tax=Cylas formicarius TaxID=197179 RepID=UPI00295860FA|nr:protein CFAP276 isoform X2 [Cylas formicarius]
MESPDPRPDEMDEGRTKTRVQETEYKHLRKGDHFGGRKSSNRRRTMAAIKVRNKSCVPHLESEGVFVEPITDDNYRRRTCFDLPAFQRMHAHHTLASARRHRRFRNFPELVPRDELDFVLASAYDQSSGLFPEAADVFLQEEATWRRLRNTRDLTPEREEIQGKVAKVDVRSKRTSKRAPSIPYSSVKLMNSSHHSPQTNAGYSRQPSDGNFYQY